MLDYLLEKNKKNNNFYTSGGIAVYIKDPLANGLDMEKIMQFIERKIPKKFLSEVEMVVVAHLKDFDERNINAMYENGCLYITPDQDDEADLIDDVIHEISHSLEHPYYNEIYADGELEAEFLNKRRELRNILWDHGYKTQINFFLNMEYDVEFDNFLLNIVGYDKLAMLMQGMFISPYAATSLREYFASGFTEFFMHPDHKLLKSVSPVLYEKLKNLYTTD